jgi:hypothetical protein
VARRHARGSVGRVPELATVGDRGRGSGTDCVVDFFFSREKGEGVSRCSLGCRLTTPHKLQAEASLDKPPRGRMGCLAPRKPMAAGVSASCGS